MSTAVPSVSVTASDGNLGVPSGDTTSVTALIGTATGGTANQVYTFQGNAGSLVKQTFTSGTLADWGRNHLLYSGGKQTLMVRGTGSTAGSNSAVTASGSGPTVTLTGTAIDDAELQMVVVSGGAIGTATVKFSLDGGRTFGPTRTSASTLAIGNGVTANLAAGTYVAAETYSATLTGPRNSVADVGDALDALLNGSSRFGLVHLLGHPASGADLATLIAAVQPKMAAAALQAKFPAFAILEAPPVDPATIVTALASVDAPDVMVCGGFATIYDDSDRQIEKVSIARAVAARLARNPISVAPSRRADDSDLEALAGIRDIFPAGSTGTDGYLDSFLSPTLNNARLTTAYRIPGRVGSYVCNAFPLTSTTSDTFEAENKRVIARSREVLYDGALRHLQRRLRRNPQTGFLDEGQAIAIDRDLEQQLRTALVEDGHATAVRVVTNRADNLASDPTLRIKARVVAVTRARTIEVEVGLAVAL